MTDYDETENNITRAEQAEKRENSERSADAGIGESIREFEYKLMNATEAEKDSKRLEIF